MLTSWGPECRFWSISYAGLEPSFWSHANTQSDSASGSMIFLFLFSLFLEWKAFFGNSVIWCQNFENKKLMRAVWAEKCWELVANFWPKWSRECSCFISEMKIKLIKHCMRTSDAISCIWAYVHFYNYSELSNSLGRCCKSHLSDDHTHPYPNVFQLWNSQDHPRISRHIIGWKLGPLQMGWFRLIIVASKLLI